MRWSGYLQEVQKKRVQGMYEGISGDRVKLEGGTGQKRKSCEERKMTRMHVQCLARNVYWGEGGEGFEAGEDDDPPPPAAMNRAAVVLNPLIFLHSLARFCDHNNCVSTMNSE